MECLHESWNTWDKMGHHPYNYWSSFLTQFWSFFQLRCAPSSAAELLFSLHYSSLLEASFHSTTYEPFWTNIHVTCIDRFEGFKIMTMRVYIYRWINYLLRDSLLVPPFLTGSVRPVNKLIRETGLSSSFSPISTSLSKLSFVATSTEFSMPLSSSSYVRTCN